jgi:hypothetical protein
MPGTPSMVASSSPSFTVIDFLRGVEVLVDRLAVRKIVRRERSCSGRGSGSPRQPGTRSLGSPTRPQTWACYEKSAHRKPIPGASRCRDGGCCSSKGNGTMGTAQAGGRPEEYRSITRACALNVTAYVFRALGQQTRRDPRGSKSPNRSGPRGRLRPVSHRTGRFRSPH